jgi:DNA polymerase-3 subunit delta'
VRDLNSLIRLTLDTPTLIVCKNIHEAGTEALNAFLKNLEEPQENVYFALTAPSVRKVLPTIVSRCQVIRVSEVKEPEINEAEISKFITASPGQRLAFFDKIKDREEAREFVESLIFFLHKKKEFKNMEVLLKTLSGLNANGNVNLQLTNLVTKYA